MLNNLKRKNSKQVIDSGSLMDFIIAEGFSVNFMFFEANCMKTDELFATD